MKNALIMKLTYTKKIVRELQVMIRSNLAEESKYENIIKRYSDTQLIYEQAILNKQYKQILSQKKTLEEEINRRLAESLESNKK